MSEILNIFILSDSLGDTAAAMVSAAAVQFAEEDTRVERLPKISSLDQVKSYMTSRLAKHENSLSGATVVFYTITDLELRNKVAQYFKEIDLTSVDLLGPAIEAITKATGKAPLGRPGVNRVLDEAYFRRIEAMDYSVDHDDGRLPEEYKDADIILMGVSRTSKTPLSMYLASVGYKVANLPLALGIEPPKQIYEVDRWRIFGLMSSPDVLCAIRTRRLGEVAPNIMQNYAGEEYVTRDLEEARALMRKLGIIVVRTDNRAIEETAREIITYYEMALAAHTAKQ